MKKVTMRTCSIWKYLRVSGAQGACARARGRDYVKCSSQNASHSTKAFVGAVGAIVGDAVVGVALGLADGRGVGGAAVGASVIPRLHPL